MSDRAEAIKRSRFGSLSHKERRYELKRLKVIGLLGAALLVGLTALAACPPGSRNLNLEPLGTNTFVVPTLTINDPGTYCVPAGGITTLGGITGITINSSDVVIVGETPSAPLADTSVAPWGPIIITINAGRMNVVLRSFTVYDTITDTGAYMPLVDGLTVDDVLYAGVLSGVAAIVLNGYQPEIRNCTFRMPLAAQPVVQLNAGMNAKIHDNRVIGSGTPAPLSFVFVAVNYNGLEVYDNTANMIGNLVAGSAALGVGGNLTNGVIRDNTATIYGPVLAGKTAGIVVEGANVEIRGNNLTVGNYNPPAGAAGVGALILVLATNATVSGNILDAGLGLDNYTGAPVGVPAPCAAIATVGTNTVIDGNSVVAVKNGPAILAYTFGGFSAINAVITNNTITNVVDPFIFDQLGATFDYDSDTFNDGAAIYLYALNARVEGNTINGVTGTDGHGILIGMSTGNATVTGNTIKNVDDGAGIFVLGSMNNQIQGNTLEDIGQDGVLLTYNNLQFPGIPTYADNNTVRGNTVRRAALRAVVDLTTPNPAVGDPLVGDYAGIRLNAASNNTIDGNTIEDAGGLVWPAWICGVDVALRQVVAANPLPVGATTMNNQIVNNTIRYSTQAGNIGSSAIGILVQAGMNHLVQGNTIENTGNMQIGLDIRTANRMTVKANEVEGMMYAGLYIRGGTVINRLTVDGNRFTDNYIGIALSAGAADLTGNKVTGGQTALLVDRFGVAGQFKVEQNCFTATTLVRNSGTGLLTAKRNFWGATPVAGTNVFGSVDFSEPLASCPGEVTPPTGTSNTYGAAAGWYMVSVPTTGDNASIFGVTLYNWNGTAYDTGITALNPNMGYWARLPGSATVTATGTIPTTDQTLTLTRTGWHMVSAPWNYPKSAILVVRGAETRSWADAVTAGWVQDTIWGWPGPGGAYASASTLQAWYGYWVRARVDGLSLRFLYASRTATMCVSCLRLEPATDLAADELLPPPPPTEATGAAEIKFGNYPNPIRDVHTTTFQVLGPLASLVSEIKVVIFDLSGKVVWQGSAAGAELDWHTDDLAGRYLANGVYFYQITAQVAGTSVSSGIMKLAIYR
ncbi:MAG: right-handed parallel beta-helix repeat-containing protein [Candidatus Thermoplasmatota archaeon]|nr:right-handed parallel beta-helix repeat-containing protein [Candidatus Thermoplasmatota archaeon]